MVVQRRDGPRRLRDHDDAILDRLLLRGVILLGIESAPLSEDDEDDVDDDVSSTEYTGRMSTSHG